MKKTERPITPSQALRSLGYRSGERLALKRNRAAVVPLEDLELLEKLEDRIDVELSKKALDEGDGVAWDEIKHEFGL